jgi:hypothetical protein
VRQIDQFEKLRAGINSSRLRWACSCAKKTEPALIVVWFAVTERPTAGNINAVATGANYI